MLSRARAWTLAGKRHAVGAAVCLGFLAPAVGWGQPELPVPKVAEAKKADEPKNGDKKNGDKKNGDADGKLEAKNGHVEPEAPGLDATAGPMYSLTDCVMLAYQRQPTIAAARASLRATEIGLAALENQGRLAALLAPDLDCRKEQAIRGIAIAQAEVNQAHIDTLYNVQRTYWTAVYASTQYELATGSVKTLTGFRDRIQKSLEEDEFGKGDINPNTVATLTILASQAESKRQEAASGVSRALAALREAIGVGPDHCFVIRDVQLPFVALTATREQSLALALTRRADVIQAALAAEVFRIEVCAQNALRIRPTGRTFAQGSDLHVRSVPLGSRDANYRPDAIGLEMPGTVVGKREERMARVDALRERADAVYAKVYGLVTLETENAYRTWVESQRQIEAIKPAMKASADYEKRNPDADIFRLLEGGVVVRQITARTLLTQTAASFNEEVYQSILAAIALERVTAGGVVIQYSERPAIEILRAEIAAKNGNGKKKNGDDEKKDDEKKDDEQVRKALKK